MALTYEQHSGLASSRPAAFDRQVPAQNTHAGHSRRQRSGYTRRSARNLRCHAAPSVPVDKLPLSSYNFPSLPSGAPQATPLEEAVREAVGHLDQAPFLQLQSGDSTTRHSVEDADIFEEPQLWNGINRYLQEREVGQVLLLHPLEAPAPEQTARAVPSSGQIMSGISRPNHQSRLQSFAELVRAGATTADFSGRVGDCCDGEPHSQVVAFPRHRYRHRRAEQREPCKEDCSRAAPQPSAEPSRYWGVILQSRDGSQGGGCYVLKTTQSGIDDCTCIHWSLTRVCSGAPLFDQLSSAWLLHD